MYTIDVLSWKVVQMLAYFQAGLFSFLASLMEDGKLKCDLEYYAFSSIMLSHMEPGEMPSEVRKMLLPQGRLILGLVVISLVRSAIKVLVLLMD